jgi:hypothetical protein
VQPERDLSVTWRPISLLFKNEPPETSDYFEPVNFTHKLLRVMESVQAAAATPEAGNDRVFKLYWESGSRIHHDGNCDVTATELLAAVGLDTSHAQAFDDEQWDTPIRSKMDDGLALVGQSGTPTIAVGRSDGERAGYFDPIINKVPPKDKGRAMSNGLVAMMEVDSFFELKRTRSSGIDFGDRPK